MTDAETTELDLRRRVLWSALLGIYLVLLGWLVLWKLDTPYVGRIADGPVNLVPFADSASSPAEFGGNVLLFVPLGVYVGLLAPSWQWWKIGALAVAVSLVLESAQFALGLGFPDVADLMANTAGGLAGFGLMLLARRRLHDRTEAVMTWICVGATAVAIVAIAVFIASPSHYRPPEDVGPLASERTA